MRAKLWGAIMTGLLKRVLEILHIAQIVKITEGHITCFKPIIFSDIKNKTNTHRSSLPTCRRTRTIHNGDDFPFMSYAGFRN